MKMNNSVFAGLLACIVLLPCCTPVLRAQAPVATAAGASLPLNAVLVLPRKFCKTVFKRGSFLAKRRDKFKVGKMACAELPLALTPIFQTLTVASAPPSSGDAQLVLLPKFTGEHATGSMFAFENRKMTVSLEWTTKDSAGRTIWSQTVQGSAKHHKGNMFTHGHDVKLLVRDTVKDLAAQSAAAMEAAPELRNLTSAKATPGN